MTIDAEFLQNRLPAFYRQRDAEQDDALYALLTLLAEQGNLLEADIAKLYDNWFIETCEDWLIPYIGDLLGVRGLYDVERTEASNQRALVANTLRLRRRKGTVPVLEELAYNTTGWRARAVEFFQLLATTQHVNHRRLSNLRTPDLRKSALLERINGPFQEAEHTLEVRSLPIGQYNLPNIGLFLWRLQAYSVLRGTAARASSEDGFYTFDPLGRSLPLFNRPRTETEITHLAEPINVPEPLLRRTLYEELHTYRQSIVDNGPDPRRYFAGGPGGPVLRIWIDNKPIPAEHIIICNLSALSDITPGQWRRPPASTTIKSESGTSERTFPDGADTPLVCVDPELGRISLPAGISPEKVEVAYTYGFPGDLGGGPYDRRLLHNADEARSGLLDPREFDQVINVRATLGSPENPADRNTESQNYVSDLKAAIEAIDFQKSGCLIRLHGDSTDVVAPDLDLAGKERFHLAIEGMNRRRPVLIGDFTFNGDGGDSRLTLSGLLLAGDLKLSGSIQSVELHHCSLLPASGGITHSGSDSVHDLVLTHCICGPLTGKATGSAPNDDIYGHILNTDLRDCVIDAGDHRTQALAGKNMILNRCTVIGITDAIQMEASNTLFTGMVTIKRSQHGCMRFCYIPPDSKTPRRYRCLPELLLSGLPPADATREKSRVSPSFTSLEYGNAGYTQLELSTAIEIRTGADDGAEIGVWNSLKQPQREENLKIALEEYTRCGMTAKALFIN